MNIFVLDTDPSKAAQYHCDSHVMKMILESAQLLGVAHITLDGSGLARERVLDLLRPTHENHPCARWVRESLGNYMWTHSLMTCLLQEYTRRFGKVHRYESLGAQLGKYPLGYARAALVERTPFMQCMPPQYRNSRSPVQAYRDYYYAEKQHLAKWHAPATTPRWWVRMEEETQHVHS